MRKIKFRAWDGVTKTMYKEKDSWRTYLNGGVGLEGTWSTQYVVLMQYAGFKDDYDKEIYEGDRLKITLSRPGKPDEVYLGEVMWDKHGGRWIFFGINYEIITFNEIFKDDDVDWATKVIGNNYENPELRKSLCT